jgi:hypothetical protein
LAAITVANAETFAAATGDRRIEVVCADATRFDPPQTPLVYYFFQPFNNEEPYRLVVENLRRSFRANPRKAFVLLRTSQWAPIFLASGILRLVAEARMPWSLGSPVQYRYAVFETLE